MKKKHFLLAGCISLTPSLSMQAALPEKPNILLILVDDLGYGDLSCQGVSNDIRTPHIDKLLNEGIRCTDFHANCPVSSPSRASLLTGRFPDMVGVPGVIRTHKEDSWGYLSREAVLLPQVLKQQQYHTAIIGKWHLGLDSPNTPLERGFDFFHGFLGDMMDDYYTHLRFGNNYMRQNNTVIEPQGHASELFSNWAIDYVNKQKGGKEPFFLYLAYNAPHVPVQPPAEWLDKVKKRESGISEKRAKLVALIEHLDDNIGRVCKALEANGQLENTLIIFASDNGGQEDAGANNKPFRGAKQEMYEGGICVAGGFYWKGKIKPAVNNNFIMLSDIFPTLCNLTNAAFSHKIDGISVLPVLEGKEQTTDERIVHWVRREGNFRYGGQVYYASRYKTYKLMQNTPWEPYRLFNLADDPEERKPINDRSSEIYQTLFKELMEHIRIAGAVPWQSAEDVK
jgi:arylsulfatase A-like enzyme